MPLIPASFRTAIRVCPAILLLLDWCAIAGAFNEPFKYLIASSSRTGKIAYLKIPEGGAYAEGAMVDLITGLTHPQGLAVDQPRKKLYIADPDSLKLLAYTLRGDSSGALSASDPTWVAEHVEVRWVAVDGVGTLYMSDEAHNHILKLTPQMMAQGKMRPDIIYNGAMLTSASAPGGVATDNFQVFWVNKDRGTQVGSLIRGPVSPATALLSTNGAATGYSALYNTVNNSAGKFFYFDDTSIPGVPKPTYNAAGSATVSVAQYRSGQLLWSGRVSIITDAVSPDANACPTCNAHGRREPLSSAEDGQWLVGDSVHFVGTSQAASLQVSTAASNVVKSYGVCLAQGNIFYTDDERNLWAVKRSGGSPVAITDQLANPRGMVYDQDGTVYVADKTNNALYQFASNMKILHSQTLVKAADFEGAFGVAMYVDLENM